VRLPIEDEWSSRTDSTKLQTREACSLQENGAGGLDQLYNTTWLTSLKDKVFKLEYTGSKSKIPAHFCGEVSYYLDMLAYSIFIDHKWIRLAF
jgi:hypothetical protein